MEEEPCLLACSPWLAQLLAAFLTQPSITGPGIALPTVSYAPAPTRTSIINQDNATTDLPTESSDAGIFLME